MEDVYWQVSLAYIVDVGETAGRNKSFNFQMSHSTCTVQNIWDSNKAETSDKWGAVEFHKRFHKLAYLFNNIFLKKV